MRRRTTLPLPCILRFTVSFTLVCSDDSFLHCHDDCTPIHYDETQQRKTKGVPTSRRNRSELVIADTAHAQNPAAEQLQHENAFDDLTDKQNEKSFRYMY